jgi:hypothetical protein
MMVDEDDPRDVDLPRSGSERDILAERRARRAEPGEPPPARRTEAVEATVRTLETNLTNLQRRLRDSADEQQRMSERLAEREHELRRVKQREYAEQQLRVEAEDRHDHLLRERRAEIDQLHRRLNASERRARELADQLESVRRELAETEQGAAAEHVAMQRAQQELAAREADLEMREGALEHASTELEERLSAAGDAELKASALREESERRSKELERRVHELEHRVGEVHREVHSGRVALERSERRLDAMRQSQLRTKLIVGELNGVAAALRATLARAPKHDELHPGAQPVREQAHRGEMADALAAAVERLRARVAAVSEAEGAPPSTPAPPGTPAPSSTAAPPSAPTPPSTATSRTSSTAGLEPRPPERDGVVFRPRVLHAPPRRESWLAPAIRRVAERRDAALAGELICELLPAQRLVVGRPLAYGLKIQELGSFQVRLDGRHATVEREGTLSASRGKLDFRVEGTAAAFSELAAGGAGRRLSGLRVRGRKRRARELLAARRPPLALADLAGAGIRVWPGLLLLALAEAIDPAWTVGHRFEAAFAIQGVSLATLYVHVRDGEPLLVTRVPGEEAGEVPGDEAGEEAGEEPARLRRITALLSERAFLCMLAGVSLPAQEQVLVDGDVDVLEQFIVWADRAQGLG